MESGEIELATVYMHLTHRDINYIRVEICELVYSEERGQVHVMLVEKLLNKFDLVTSYE